MGHQDDYTMFNDFIKQYEVIIFIRLMKLLTLLYELKVMRIIIETAKNMMAPLTYMFCVLMIVFYLFAYVGMGFFGG